MVKPFRMFAVASPGLENVVLRELRSSGVPVGQLKRVHGGVEFTGHRNALFESNLKLKSCSRILLRVGKFKATSKIEFIQGFSSLPWDKLLSFHQVALKVSVSSNKSKLFHTGFIEKLCSEAMGPYLAGSTGKGDDPVQDTHLIVNINSDVVSVSINSSGDHLHKRLYRQDEPAQMPIKETAAAGFLTLSGWSEEERKDAPARDPFCGTGTILLEAALMRANKAPGLVRLENGGSFHFQSWPMFASQPELFQQVVDRAMEAVLPPPPEPLLVGSDRFDAAVQTARVCAKKAGMTDWVSFETAPLSQAPFPSDWPRKQGYILTNPPFGPRAGQAQELTGLYKAMGDIFRRNVLGWKVCIVCPSATENRKLLRETGINFKQDDVFLNGGRRMVVATGVARPLVQKQRHKSSKDNENQQKQE